MADPFATVTIDDTEYQIETEEGWLVAKAGIDKVLASGRGVVQLATPDGTYTIPLHDGDELRYRVGGVEGPVSDE